MDISSHFSLEDFLAYFFPGVVGALGIYILLTLTPWSVALPSLTADLTSGIIFFILSYITGVLFSGVSELLFSHVPGHKAKLPFHEEMNKLVLAAFRKTFRLPKGPQVEWSREHYYLCRSYVYEQMPGILSLVQRQSSLRQLRINLILPLVIWLAVGVTWGVQSLLNQAAVDGLIKIVVSLILFIPILIITINRAMSNEWREVREVLTAFVANASLGDTPEEKIDKTRQEPKVKGN